MSSISVNVNVDIELDDVYDEMGSYEKKQMAKWLREDGYCLFGDDQDENEFEIENPNVLDEMWIDMVKKIFHGRMQLSLEDEETIRKIANKL
jgi:hypothetical protein